MSDLYAASKPSHKQFQADVVAQAVARGWMCHYVTDSRRSPGGWPDLFMVKGDRAIAAELKIPPDKPRADQEAWLVALAELPNVTAGVYIPADYDQVLALLS